MTLAVQAQFDAFVAQSLSAESFANAGSAQEFYARLFQHTCADTLFTMSARLRFQNDRVDPIQVEQMRKHQAGRPSAYNSDLR
jgi:hypothetical protein